MSLTKKMVFTAICSALCVVLPMAFHAVPDAGTVFLPMHIPVLLCGLACGWPYGLACGILGPILSSLLTSMPPMAMLPSMAVECAVYGLATGLGMTFIRTKNTYADLYISMILAMLCGRTIAGFIKAWILSPGTPPFIWVTSSLVKGIPGICIQLAVMPILIFALTRTRFLPRRYESFKSATK